MSYVTDGDDQGESRADLDAFILIVWLTGLVMKCMWGVERTRIVPRFLAWAVGWMEVPFTEIGKHVRKAEKAGEVGKWGSGEAATWPWPCSVQVSIRLPSDLVKEADGSLCFKLSKKASVRVITLGIISLKLPPEAMGWIRSPKKAIVIRREKRAETHTVGLPTVTGQAEKQMPAKSLRSHGHITG